MDAFLVFVNTSEEEPYKKPTFGTEQERMH